MSNTYAGDYLQVGNSATATQNFVLKVPAAPDGTISLLRGNYGAESATIFSVSAAGLITATAGLVIPTTKAVNFAAAGGSGTPTSQDLKYYEEGTWTPVGSTSGGTANTYGTVTGTYTKIGRAATLEFSIAVTTNNGFGQFYVDGIPFSITDTKAAGCGIDSTISGKLLRVNRQTDTRLLVLDYSSAYPAVSGSTLIGSITYFV